MNGDRLAPPMPAAPHIVAVELLPEYPSVIRLTDVNGARYHYRQNPNGHLELGRPFRPAPCDGYNVHLFWPLEPGAPPSVLKVVKQ